MRQGLLLSVAAACWLGCYLVVAKRYFSHYPPVLYVALSNITGLCWYLPVVLLTVPPAQRLPKSFDLWSAGILAGTAVCTAIALLSFYHALAIGDVSYVAPLSKIVPVFVLPLEVLLLDQQLSGLQITGVLVATLAVYVANYRTGSVVEPLRQLAGNRAAGFALVSAATFGVVDLGKRLSMQELAVPPETFVVVMLVTVLALVAPFAVRHRNAVDVRGDARKLFGVGILVAGGQHLIAAAFQTLPASVVSPIVNTQAIVAVVLGSLLLDEDQFYRRLAAGALAVGGIALITIG